MILGASVRAAAASALRAGYAPWCADLFADADLIRACPAYKIALDQYPEALINAAREASPGPWLYTGALENRLDIVARIDRPLWGNPPDVLRRVRSPRLVRECLTRCALPCPEIATSNPDPRGAWLVKPYRSAGGHGIRRWTPGNSFDSRRYYLQEWIEGEAHAAVFLGQPGHETFLLGLTRQLVGEPWLNAAPFQYCGSVGPVAPSPALELGLRKLGQALADEFALRGLFGVDLIIRDDVPWPVEINPRYTASMEILERTTGLGLLGLHADVFEEQGATGLGPVARPEPRGQAPWLKARRNLSLEGKFILYARSAFTFPARGFWEPALRQPLDDPTVAFADIPQGGERIVNGQPILTLFGSFEHVRSHLASWEADLYGSEPS